MVRFLPDCTDDAIRGGLSEVAPELVGAGIDHVARTPDVEPDWFRGTARLGEHHLVKFAWSAPAARRIVVEARVLAALADTGLPTPRLVHEPTDLACFVTRFVPGEPLERDGVPTGGALEWWCEQVGSFFAQLHRIDRGVVAATPPPERMVQSTTDQLRAGDFLGIVAARQRPTVLAWCDWIDEVLSAEVDRVLVHGDFHGHNLRWSPADAELLLVADFETAGAGDPALDFRYQLTQSATDDLLVGVLDAYRAHGGVVSTSRVVAWALLSVLGDARWRTFQGVDLPDGGTPVQWVDDLAARVPRFGVPPG